jgi:hypothetical protein
MVKGSGAIAFELSTLTLRGAGSGRLFVYDAARHRLAKLSPS